MKPVASIDTHTEKIIDDLIARIGWAQHFARLYRDGFCKATGEPLEFHSLPWEQSNLPSERQGKKLLDENYVKNCNEFSCQV